MPWYQFVLIVLSMLSGMSGASAGQTLPSNNLAKIALDIIRMEACEMSWNTRIDEADDQGTNIKAAKIPLGDPGGIPQAQPFSMGDITGWKYAFSSNSPVDADVCGWIFIPDGGDDSLAQQAGSIQRQAIEGAMAGGFATAAMEIYSVIEHSRQNGLPTAPEAMPPIHYVIDAIAGYSASQNGAMSTLTGGSTQIRVVAEGSAPITSPPRTTSELPGKKPSGLYALWLKMNGGDPSNAADLRAKVVEDMHVCEFYLQRSINSTDGVNNAPPQEVKSAR